MKMYSNLTRLFLVVLLAIPFTLNAQDFSRTIERTLRFNQPENLANTLNIHNIHGNVTVEGYNGTDIRITASQTIEGTSDEVEQGRDELEFKTERNGNTVYVYIDSPFITFEKRGDHHLNYNIKNWDNTYDFLHDITIQVPRQTNIYASTINRGTVEVSNTSLRVEAMNVNGKVSLKNIAGATNAKTVNGDIDIKYARAPNENSEYKTVNGTIEVQYPGDLSADIRFKSLHGELYTDFQNVKRLKTQVSTNKRNSRGSVRYKVDRSSPIRIGNGGPTFNFEVLNGNVYIKRI